MKLITRWLLLAAALLLVAHLYSGVQVASFGSAMIAALVLGLLNSVWRWYRPDGPLTLAHISDAVVEGCVRLVK